MLVQDEPPSFSTPPDEVGAVGYGVASDVRDRPLIRLSICPNLVSRADLGNPWRDLFNCAHTHPSWGVDGPFGVY